MLKTLEREKTKNDIYSELWSKQAQLVQQSKQTSIFETNGHTIVPLDDSSLERYFKLMEEAGGSQLAYNVMPYKVIIQENVSRWDSDKNKSEMDKEMCRVKVSFPDDWEIDEALWKMWEKKYSGKYPKAIATIRQMIEDIGICKHSS